MEADWEFEIASGAPVPDAPVIDANWQGFADLTADPRRALQLPEAAQLPALAEALMKLNAPHSPAFTSKCDFWSVNPQEVALDADELNAEPDEMAFACACYVDLLARSRERWRHANAAARDCAVFCAGLRNVALRCCRTDLVIRRAMFSVGDDALGVTAYLTACGATEADAREALSRAVAAFADSILSIAPR